MANFRGTEVNPWAQFTGSALEAFDTTTAINQRNLNTLNMVEEREAKKRSQKALEDFAAKTDQLMNWSQEGAAEDYAGEVGEAMDAIPTKKTEGQDTMAIIDAAASGQGMDAALDKTAIKTRQSGADVAAAAAEKNIATASSAREAFEKAKQELIMASGGDSSIVDSYVQGAVGNNAAAAASALESGNTDAAERYARRIDMLSGGDGTMIGKGKDGRLLYGDKYLDVQRLSDIATLSREGVTGLEQLRTSRAEIKQRQENWEKTHSLNYNKALSDREIQMLGLALDRDKFNQTVREWETMSPYERDLIRSEVYRNLREGDAAGGQGGMTTTDMLKVGDDVVKHVREQQSMEGGPREELYANDNAINDVQRDAMLIANANANTSVPTNTALLAESAEEYQMWTKGINEAEGGLPTFGYNITEDGQPFMELQSGSTVIMPREFARKIAQKDPEFAAALQGEKAEQKPQTALQQGGGPRTGESPAVRLTPEARSDKGTDEFNRRITAIDKSDMSPEEKKAAKGQQYEGLFRSKGVTPEQFKEMYVSWKNKYRPDITDGRKREEYGLPTRGIGANPVYKSRNELAKDIGVKPVEIDNYAAYLGL